MNGTQRVLSIAVVWAGLVGLGAIAHISGHLDGAGISGLAFAGFCLTIAFSR